MCTFVSKWKKRKLEENFKWTLVPTKNSKIERKKRQIGSLQSAIGQKNWSVGLLSYFRWE